MEYLIVVDMQKDFVNGALGSQMAVDIIPAVQKKIRNFQGKVLFTRDTHQKNYMETQEGKKLPIPHCIQGTDGWEIIPELREFCKEEPINKPTFGSIQLMERLQKENESEPVTSIQLIGVCTDICVISNALLLKAALPEVPVSVDASCCAGVTEESHQRALLAMQACQINIEGEFR